MTSLVLFDFDGTLTKCDTTRYLLMALGMERAHRVLSALPHALAMKRAANDFELQRAKVACIGAMLGGMPVSQLDQGLIRFGRRVRRLVRPEVKTALVQQAECHRGVVVTASPDFVVRAVFPELEVPVLGTQFSVVNGMFTGEVQGDICYGAEKVARVRAYIDEKCAIGTDVAEAWSDALSDRPMMDMAPVRHWVCASDRDSAAIQILDPSGHIITVR